MVYGWTVITTINAMVSATMAPPSNTGMCDRGSSAPSLHRGLHAAPAPNRQYRQNATCRCQRRPEAVANSRDGQGRHQLNDRDATCDECERRADPGEERPLVRERESIIQILVDRRPLLTTNQPRVPGR